MDLTLLRSTHSSSTITPSSASTVSSASNSLGGDSNRRPPESVFVFPRAQSRASIDHRIIITDSQSRVKGCQCSLCLSPLAEVDGLGKPTCWCRCSDCCRIEDCCAAARAAQCNTSPEENMLNGSSATSSSANSTIGYFVPGNSMQNPQTIEEQIKHVDRIIKDCDISRKNLELMNRRLDDLNDEVRRYREFLAHEKSRRDPAMYKTTSAEQPSQFNDGICSIIGSLTSQLALEWTDKLRAIQSQTLGSRLHDKN
ncbi:hypothetical protein Ddc_06792 [Ditylenchus destructor]|nr:hypothetical protein Ddc_06792 [Ditylenchus destructor]